MVRPIIYSLQIVISCWAWVKVIECLVLNSYIKLNTTHPEWNTPLQSLVCCRPQAVVRRGERLWNDQQLLQSVLLWSADSTAAGVKSDQRDAGPPLGTPFSPAVLPVSLGGNCASRAETADPGNRCAHGTEIAWTVACRVQTEPHQPGHAATVEMEQKTLETARRDMLHFNLVF